MGKLMQLEQLWEDIDTAVQILKEFRNASEWYFHQPANLEDDNLRIGDFVLIHKATIEESHWAKLGARLREPYQVTEIPQSLGTYQLAKVDGAELVGWTDGS
jgi:hypothetical protein